MMIATTLALGWRLALYAGAGVLGGIANGVAGGGTFITFPTLLATGIPALQANVSSTVGVVPSYFGGIRGFWHHIVAHRAIVTRLLGPCLVGTLVGCALLLRGSPSTFEHVVPWLIGAATVLFALAPRITTRLEHVRHDHAARRWTLYLGVFATSVYGGYFGAGLGIMLLALTAVTLPASIAELQGLRAVLSLIINVVAAGVFLARGHLALDAVYPLLVGTLVGGWIGTVLIQHLPASWVRGLVILAGAATTVRLLVH